MHFCSTLWNTGNSMTEWLIAAEEVLSYTETKKRILQTIKKKS